MNLGWIGNMEKERRGEIRGVFGGASQPDLLTGWIWVDGRKEGSRMAPRVSTQPLGWMLVPLPKVGKTGAGPGCMLESQEFHLGLAKSKVQGETASR